MYVIIFESLLRMNIISINLGKLKCQLTNLLYNICLIKNKGIIILIKNFDHGSLFLINTYFFHLQQIIVS